MPEAERLPHTAATWRGTLKQFWSIAGGFWTGRDSRQEAIGVLAGLLLLNAAEVALYLRLNTWQRDLFDALERRDAGTVLLECGVLLLIIGGFCGVGGPPPL